MNKNTKLGAWRKFYKLNKYYHKSTHKFVSEIIPKQASVLEISCRGGELLASLRNKVKAGADSDMELIAYARKRNRKIKFTTVDNLKALGGTRYDYVLLSHTSSDIDDLQLLIKALKKHSHNQTRFVVMFFNFMWKPILDLGEILGLKTPSEKEPNWLTEDDVDNFFYLESFQKIKSGRNFLFPYKIPVLSTVFNRYISKLPLINSLCLNAYLMYKPIAPKKDYSVSIVIPARNEEGNMKGIFKKIPKFGKKIEIIFVEGHSKDNTYRVIANEIKKYKGPIKASLFKQNGIGKGNAVRFGFSKAKNELLMILDADLTVDPKELPKFYEAVSQSMGELVMGSRLVYPMEKQAMRNLNYVGNKLFSTAFTYLLDQKIKDTLCGTKVLLRSDYEKIRRNRNIFGDFDPFGDYDLIFGASKLNLKIIEIPIRYKERTYGKTNISRFKHGLLLVKMCYFAVKKLKFI